MTDLDQAVLTYAELLRKQAEAGYDAELGDYETITGDTR